MYYSVIPGRKLTSELTARWSAIQRADPTLASPYFRPEFTQAVAAVRDDVFVGLLEDNGEVVGFFPFQRSRGGMARPVGLGLSDYHGVIARSDAQWTASELMQGCKLIRWEFDHLPTSQQQFAACYNDVSESPIIEVSRGMAAYEASRDKSGRKQLREARRKSEKLATEVGPLSFTLHSAHQDILQQLLTWKSEQCRRTGTVDFFALDWCVKLISRIHATRESDFGGMLACLHAGETLAAVHFAMYSRQVWHSWFPAYNHELQEYSPGFVLLLELIQAASGQGIKYIDLGKGLSLYKKRVMTGRIPVAEGCLAIPSVYNRLRAFREKLESWGKHSRLKPLLRFPGRIVRNMDRKKRYE
ncbi:MAG: cellulose biosynthesis protein CelD [Desulfobulbaceae bacterium]|nr:MAG: cellulose biosynthesis protein CelD [Desulfobulbaceae bacterium]